MTKQAKHDIENPQCRKQLIERYFNGETTDREEETLRQFLFSKCADDSRYDELRAVLAFTETGKRFSREQMRGSRKRTLPVFIRTAACAAILLGMGIAYIALPKDSCVTYIHGQKYTDTETAVKQMRQTLDAFNSPDITIEKELGAIFSPLENQQ